MKIRLQLESSERGLVLIETIAYIGLLAILMGLAMTAFLRFEEQSRRFRGVTSDIATAVSVGERWRADVRKASGPIVFDKPSNELRIPQERAQIVYRFANNTIERKGNAGFVPILQNIKSSSMQGAARTHVKSWRWEVEFNSRGKNPKLQPLFQFEAVAPEKKL